MSRSRDHFKLTSRLEKALGRQLVFHRPIAGQRSTFEAGMSL